MSLSLLSFASKPRRPARGPVGAGPPAAVPERRHDLELLVEAVVVLDPDLLFVVGGAVAHALEVVLHEVVVLLAVQHPPTQLSVAVVEVEQLRMLLLCLLDGEVHVPAEGGALIGAPGAAAASRRQAAAERHWRWGRRRHRCRRRRRSRRSGDAGQWRIQAM